MLDARQAGIVIVGAQCITLASVNRRKDLNIWLVSLTVSRRRRINSLGRFADSSLCNGMPSDSTFHTNELILWNHRVSNFEWMNRFSCLRCSEMPDLRMLAARRLKGTTKAWNLFSSAKSDGPSERATYRQVIHHLLLFIRSCMLFAQWRRQILWC